MSETIIQAMGMSSKKYGGIEKHMELLVHEMRTYGYRTVIVYNTPPLSEEYCANLKNLGCNIEILNIYQPFKYCIGFLKLLARYKPRMVHAHFEYYLPVILSAVAFVRLRLITLHSMLEGSFYRPVSDKRQLGFIKNQVRILSLRAANGIISVSDAVNKQYSTLFGLKNKIKTIYLGSKFVPEYRKDQDLHKDNIYEKVKICCIAFNSPIKGLDLLIKALAKLRYEMNNNLFEVFQIGIDIERDDVNGLLELAQGQGVSDIFKWLGIREDVQILLPSMDIYCQPSRSEGLSLSIVEASFAGLPTVATNIGGIPEAVLDGKTGLLFQNGNIDDLAIKLNELILDRNKRSRMGSEAYIFASQRFNTESQLKIISDYYLEKLSILEK